MEIELKYLVEEAITKERIFYDKHLRQLADESTVETIPMRAVYFDTETRALMKREMAFRVRYEDARLVATLKWGGSNESALHVRGELNVPVDEDFLDAPTVEIFKGSAIYEELSHATSGDKLLPVMEMDFVRRQMQVDTGKSISMVSYDEGEIKTSAGNAPISELEIELYSGKEEDMIALGEEIAAKYNLKEGNKSKYQRGLELLGLIK